MKIGLIGRGISQSRAPELHQMLAGKLNLNYEYQLHDALASDFIDFQTTLKHLKNAGYRGVNVTYPFKELALKCADSATVGAQRVGASNTLLFSDQVLAENTDYSGFIKAYHANFGTKKAGSVLLIGGGGVGRAVAFALSELGVEKIYLSEINTQKGESLVTQLCDLDIKAELVNPDEAPRFIDHIDGILNCSTMGHHNSPGCPIPVQSLNSKHWVFDAVYIPAKTELITHATAVGARVLSGVELFLFQGFDAFECFASTLEKPALIAPFIPEIRTHYLRILNA
ncbi:MAG: shikimate dehydrogenase [Gammaproteobacteria bacterium]|nr:shikimate dehydrogenase [Gammaproteobacteria bacterium]